jgi:hypothetical protein
MKLTKAEKLCFQILIENIENRFYELEMKLKEFWFNETIELKG